MSEDNVLDLVGRLRSTLAEASRTLELRADWAARVRENWNASEKTSEGAVETQLSSVKKA